MTEEGRAGSGSPPLLEVRGLGKRFGAVAALEAVDFVAGRGEVHALTGANGAGKSTLMNLLAGVHAPSAGEILIDGAAVRFASPAEARAAGVAAVYQELAVLPELSVAENVWLGREPRTRAGLLDRRALQADTARLLEAFRLPLDPSAIAGTLGVASRQLVEIARALSSSARILTLDEPTAVLSAEERSRLFDTVAELKRRGLLVLFVSHRLDEVFEIADRVTVLRNGRRVFSAATAEVTRAELVRHMVGHDVDDRTRAAPLAPSAAPPLAITVHASPAAFELRLEPGEIVGLGGLVGSGRTRLARRLAGLEEGVAVDYRIGERRFTVHSPAQAVARGIVYLTEDRKRDGLFAGLSVLRNASAATLGGLSRLGFVDAREERRRVAPMLERLKVVAASLGAPVRALSGGNQQKVLFARALLARPLLLLCDEPTRGVDVGAREEIYAVIDTLSKQGVTIVVVSSDLKELLSLCHRILVVRDAAIVAELPASASELEIVDAAVVRAPVAAA
ncbi:MAG: sugar ABC transporter ATP-binding protein [Burkholderiales bacterium]|nr:sugar ABC transporter ATP-binding protein [Burkholderiales bacterium]